MRRMFEPFGKVVSCYLYSAGKSRFSFVQMSYEAEGESAIEGLNGGEFFGRELVIAWAVKQRPVRLEKRECAAEKILLRSMRE